MTINRVNIFSVFNRTILFLSGKSQIISTGSPAEDYVNLPIPTMVAKRKNYLKLTYLTLLFGLCLLGQVNAQRPGATYCGPYKPTKTLNLNGVRDIVISGVEISNPSGHAISIVNCHNVIIENNFLHHSSGNGINIISSTNVTIRNNRMESIATGVYAQKSTGIKVLHNDVKNVLGPFPRGQLAQFNGCYGPSNEINYNAMENILGESYAEDAINLYKSHGTANSPIEIKGNWVRGGGPSGTGGGIMTGDNGGSHVLVKDNILVNPGQYGIAIAGGTDIEIYDNTVYGKQKPFTNAGIYIWNQSTNSVDCSTNRIANNTVYWEDKNGKLNASWNNGNCGRVIEWKSNTWNANIDKNILSPQILMDCMPMSLSINDVSRSEGNTDLTQFTFKVSIDDAILANSKVEFNYRTSDQSATGTTGDFVAITNGKGTIAKGKNSTNLTVMVKGDTALEVNEKFKVFLFDATNASINDSKGIGTIRNDDKALIDISTPLAKAEGNTGKTKQRFYVSIDQHDANFPIRVHYAIKGGNEDGEKGTLTFPARTKLYSKTVIISTNGDNLAEEDETVSVRLSNPTNNAKVVTKISTSSFINDDENLVEEEEEETASLEKEGEVEGEEEETTTQEEEKEEETTTQEEVEEEEKNNIEEEEVENSTGEEEETTTQEEEKEEETISQEEEEEEEEKEEEEESNTPEVEGLSITMGEVISLPMADENKEVEISLALTESQKHKFNIYPNPFQSELKISMKADFLNIHHAMFELFGQNMSKLFVHAIREEDTEIDLSILSKGYYFYMVSVAGKLLTSGKLIKH